MAWRDRLEQRLEGSSVGSHIVRTAKRYFNRMGNHLAGSIAFFSILAIVPVLMFAFAATGLVLTVIRPEWLDEVQIFIVDNLNAGPLQDQVLILLGEYLYHWQRVGLFAVVVALVIGSTWVANLKGAIRAMGRPDFDVVHRSHSPLLEPILNIALLLVLMVLVAVTFTGTVIGTQLAGAVVDWARLGNVFISQGLVQVASLGLSFAGALLLFWLIYRYLPDVRSPNRAVVGGSLGAAVCFVLLQTGAGALTRLLSMGRATQVFGPVIVAMLFINIFAMLTLIWAAWVATWNQPAVARRYSRADRILRDREGIVTVDSHWEAAEADRQRRQRPAKKLSASLGEDAAGRPALLIGTGASRLRRPRRPA